MWWQQHSNSRHKLEVRVPCTLLSLEIIFNHKCYLSTTMFLKKSSKCLLIIKGFSNKKKERKKEDTPSCSLLLPYLKLFGNCEGSHKAKAQLWGQGLWGSCGFLSSFLGRRSRFWVTFRPEFHPQGTEKATFPLELSQPPNLALNLYIQFIEWCGFCLKALS